MSDIDFDELDRAVASVLNGSDAPKNPAVNPAAPAPVASTPAVEPAKAQANTNESEAEPIAVNVTTVAAASTPVQPAVTVPEPIKEPAVSAQDLHAQPVKPVQRGRFLDMVHPSRDMSTKPAAVATPTLTPAPSVTPTPPAPIANPTFVSDVVAPTPVQPAVNAPDPALAPLVAAQTPAPAETPAGDGPANNEPISDDLPTDFFAQSSDEASKSTEPASPFIPDAKVEKRPLGAFSAEAAGVNLPEGDDLHSKLVQVESEDNVIETAESPIPATAPATPFAAPKTKPAPTVAAAPTPTTPAADTTPAFNLFDHDEPAPVPKKVKQPKPPKAAKQPKPAKTPADKAPKYGKGTLIWVTVAVAVMLIGFGVGATLYFLVLQ